MCGSLACCRSQGTCSTNRPRHLQNRRRTNHSRARSPPLARKSNNDQRTSPPTESTGMGCHNTLAAWGLWMQWAGANDPGCECAGAFALHAMSFYSIQMSVCGVHVMWHCGNGLMAIPQSEVQLHASDTTLMRLRSMHSRRCLAELDCSNLRSMLHVSQGHDMLDCM